MCYFWHVYEKSLRCVLPRISRRRAPAECLLSDHSAEGIILLFLWAFLAYVKAYKSCFARRWGEAIVVCVCFNSCLGYK